MCFRFDGATAEEIGGEAMEMERLIWGDFFRRFLPKRDRGRLRHTDTDRSRLTQTETNKNTVTQTETVRHRLRQR